MSQPPVLIVDSHENRRRKLAVLTRASTGIETGAFQSMAHAFPGFRNLGTSLFPTEVRLCICPWDEGGEALVLERLAMGGGGPALIALCREVTAARITIARRAGNVHLVLDNPLDTRALMTRVLLTLEGPGPLFGRAAKGLGARLCGFPALQRRLAAG